MPRSAPSVTANAGIYCIYMHVVGMRRRFEVVKNIIMNVSACRQTGIKHGERFLIGSNQSSILPQPNDRPTNHHATQQTSHSRRSRYKVIRNSSDVVSNQRRRRHAPRSTAGQFTYALILDNII